LFRAIALLDVFLKQTNMFETILIYFRVFADIHLVGMVCMFLATKIEDIYQIPMKEFVQKVGHDKFSPEDIKRVE
jgi:hypothetical protein